VYSKYNLSTQPSRDDEDYIDMGAAKLQFYSSLVDLLGRCAPEAEAIKAGRSDSLRARAILRSLVLLEDLEGALGIRFILPVKKTEQVRSLLIRKIKFVPFRRGSVAKWLACWTQAQKGVGSNRSRDAVG